ncbi:hypothetical protein MAP00_008254 [Monascus purpureus]|nr:hypothetical protein MAP00_008254 [Monascus purpureus]
MPPTFRSSRSGRQFIDNSTNRGRSGHFDHDIFEGIPVRRWTRQQHTVSQAPKPDESEPKTPGYGGMSSLPELAMPKDSQLLMPASRALLRAARAGCIYIRHVDKDVEDDEKETTDVEDLVAANGMERNFTTRKWALVPRHLEPPETEYLAKRRLGLPALYGASAKVSDGIADNASGPMRRTKFTRVDPATGNISVYEAWVPEGYKIEGEVTGAVQTISASNDADVKPETLAPGTVVEGVGVVDSEGVVVAETSSAAVVTPKRRPPPPKRKAKGFAKGRRKKVMFASGEGVDAAAVHGAHGGSVAGVGEGDASHMSVDPQSEQEYDAEDGEEDEESDSDASMIDVKSPEATTPGPQLSVVSDRHPDTPAPVEKEAEKPSTSASEELSDGTSKGKQDLAVSDIPTAHAPVDDTVMADAEASSNVPEDNLPTVSQQNPETQKYPVPDSVAPGATSPKAAAPDTAALETTDRESAKAEDAVRKSAMPSSVPGAPEPSESKSAQTTTPAAPDSKVPEATQEPAGAPTEKNDQAPSGENVEETSLLPPVIAENIEPQSTEPSSQAQETPNATGTNEKQPEAMQMADKADTSARDPAPECTEQPHHYRPPQTTAANEENDPPIDNNGTGEQFSKIDDPTTAPPQEYGSKSPGPTFSITSSSAPSSPPPSSPSTSALAALEEEQMREEHGQEQRKPDEAAGHAGNDHAGSAPRSPEENIPSGNTPIEESKQDSEDGSKAEAEASN